MLTSWDDDRTRDRDRWRSDDFTTSTSTSTSTPTNASTSSIWSDPTYYPEQPPSPFATTNTLSMRNDHDHHIPSSQSISSTYQHPTSSMAFTSSMIFTHTTPTYSIPTTATSTSRSISSQSQSYPSSTFLPSTSTSTSSSSQSFPTSSFPSTSTSSQSFPTSSFPSSSSSSSTFPTSTFTSTSSPTSTARHLSQDLGHLLDLLSSSTTSTLTSTWAPTSSHIQPHVTSHIQQQQPRSQHLSSTYTSPLPMSITPSLPSLSPSSSSSTSTSPMPVTDSEPISKKRRSSTSPSTSTSTSTSTKSKPLPISDDVPDSLARRLKHRAIDANRRVRLSAGFDALQAMVAPGESHSQIVLLEKSGEMLRSMQAEAATLKTTLRMLKRRRARREKGLSIKEEDDEDEITMVKKEQSMGRVVSSDRPSSQFNVAHLNYFCDSNVMLSCTNLAGVLVDVNTALLRAFHLRAPEDRVGKFTLAPHTVKLATSSQPFGQHLAGIPMTYQSQKTLHGPNPPIDPSATDPRTLSGLPSSNIVMRDGTVSAQPGLIKGATTNELIPYLPSVVSLQKILRGESESCSIIFEGIDGRGQRYHARFVLWTIYNSHGTPEYIMGMCNPNSIIHFPHDSPPYYSTALRSIQGSSISIASSSSSSSSNENSPITNDFHS